MFRAAVTSAWRRITLPGHSHPRKQPSRTRVHCSSHCPIPHSEVPRGQAPRLHRVGPAPHPQATVSPPELPRSGVGWKSHPNREVRGSRSLHHDPTAPVAPVGGPDWVLRGVAVPQCRSQQWMKLGNPSVGSLAVLFSKLYSVRHSHVGFTLGVKWFERRSLSSSRKTVSSERPRGTRLTHL